MLWRSIVFLFAAGCTLLSGQVYELRLEAVSRDRANFPVSAELPAEGPPVQAGIILVAEDGSERIGQIEERRARKFLHWIEREVPAGAELLLRVHPASPDASRAAFRFHYEPDFQELRWGEEPIYRYLTVYDPRRHDETHKPYHQLFAPGGEGFITKGPGGAYPHHKGIYLGWNSTVAAPGRSYDFWHATREYQQHREFVAAREMAGPVAARSAATVEWKTPRGNVVARETREVWAWRMGEDELLLDFIVTIRPEVEVLRLEGDAHHAGVQFRAAAEVADNAAAVAIIAPEGAEPLEDDVWASAPWLALSFEVGGRSYTVGHLDHAPTNPRPTVYSAREYGRFGAFFTAEVKREEPLVLKYRILVQQGRKQPEEVRKDLAARHADFVEPPVVRVIDRR